MHINVSSKRTKTNKHVVIVNRSITHHSINGPVLILSCFGMLCISTVSVQPSLYFYTVYKIWDKNQKVDLVQTFSLYYVPLTVFESRGGASI
jgi:hypothetical protein